MHEEQETEYRRPVPLMEIVLSWYFALILTLGLAIYALIGNGLAWMHCTWTHWNDPLPSRFVPFKGCYQQLDNGQWVRSGGAQ